MWPFKKKNLESILCQTKKIKVSGIFFTIRKINPLDYFDGSKSVLQVFDLYNSAQLNDANIGHNIGKVKAHFVDVILAAVVEPKLSRTKDGEGIFVDNLFTDWELANELYEKIMEFTYGKKKLKLSNSPVRN